VSPTSRVVGDLDLLADRLMGSMAGAEVKNRRGKWLPGSVRNLLDRLTSQA
jgi:hypothetical protein